MNYKTNDRYHKCTIDSSNGKEVKSIYFVKTSKINRTIKYLVWQYFRDRNRTRVDDVLISFNRQKKQVHTAEIIYKGDPVIHKISRIPQNIANKISSQSEPSQSIEPTQSEKTSSQ